MMASPRQRHRNASIEQPRILLVEGTDDYWFFQRLIEHRQSSNVQVIEFGGKDRLGDFLANALVPDPKFSEMVEVLGVVRDADRNYESALQSVQDSLRRARLPVPTVPLTYVEGDVQGEAIRVVAYIMPDNRSSGDLEKLCLAAVTDAQAMTCVDRYIDCLKSNGLIPKYERKAKLRAFLAANPDDPTLLPGQAILANVIPWNSPAFNGIHQFLDMLDAEFSRAYS
jgi:hypothetical protein